MNRVVLILNMLLMISCMSQPDFSNNLSGVEKPLDWQEESAYLKENVAYYIPEFTNQPPTVTVELISSIDSGGQYYVKIDAVDAEGDPLTYTPKNLPRWLSFDEIGIVLYGTVNSTDAGYYEDISIDISDGNLITTIGPFSIVVTNTNNILAISGEPDFVLVENQAYQFLPSIKNVAGNELTFSITNKPSWATFNPNNGNLSGTPDFFSAQSYSDILISVSDGQNYAAIAPFSINVLNRNRSPIIESQIISVLEDGKIDFTVVASDFDAEYLNWSLPIAPINGRLEYISLENKTFTYQPEANFFGEDSFVLRVTDFNGASASALFSIKVTSVNDIPIANTDFVYLAQGTSQTVNVLLNDTGLGDGGAIDSTGIDMEISSPPSQGTATINSDGSIRYQSNANASAKDSFIYKITDANNEISLTTVNISIGAICTTNCTKVVNVSWDPSVSPNVSGYYLYYGQVSGQYDSEIWVGEFTEYQHEIKTSGGSHYFSLKAIDNLGEISAFSQEVSVDF